MKKQLKISMVIKICSRLVCNTSTNIVWHDNDDYCNDDGLIELYELLLGPEGSKSLNKRRALTHCLASIKVLELVCS